MLLQYAAPRVRTPLVLATVIGFAGGVVDRGGWPALPPVDAFWWVVWAAPFSAAVYAGLAHTSRYVRPSRAAWPQAPAALLLGYALAVRASVVLGTLGSLWGAALAGACLAHLGEPARRAFGAGATSLLVVLGLLAAAWRYAAYPVGPLVLFLVAFACLVAPLPERMRKPATWAGLLLATIAAGWSHATSRVLDLY